MTIWMGRTTRLMCWVLVSACGLGVSSPAMGGEPPAYVPGRLLVKFTPGVSKAKRDEVLARHNARETGNIPQIGVHILELPGQASETAVAKAMHGRPEVEYAELDHIGQPALIPNDPYYAYNLMPAWHLPKIGCPAAWDLTTGSTSLVIAILDTGVYSAHQDLATKTAPGWNCYDNNADTSDVSGHGTGVAGTAAAATNNNLGVASVAWGCRLMPIRICDLNGLSYSSVVASGLIYAADHGARVANHSFTTPADSTLNAAAQYLQSKGGIMVQCAGNSGIPDSTPDNPLVVKVSATDANDLVPSWSVTGSCIDLAAPGVNIPTTVGSGYGSGTGTSSSAPIVSGVAALVMSVNPGLSPQQVQDILKQSADDLGPAGWDPSYGWGRVNAARAVSMARSYGTPSDTTPPVVSITSPAPGATVSGAITVAVNATDNTGVSSVSLNVNGTLLASDSSTPYSFYWDTKTSANGTHTLTANAGDAAGNMASAQISITVDNAVADTTSPTVSFTSPAPGATVGGTVTIQASASDNIGVASVSLSVDGGLLGTDTASPYAFTWNTATVSNGSHMLTTTARDAAGNVASAQIAVMVSNAASDTTAPAITITSPRNGSTVSGNVSVTVNATDNVGTKKVELYVDGVLKATSTSAPFTTTWNSRKASKGGHGLQCKAYDAAVNVGGSPVVTVYK